MENISRSSKKSKTACTGLSICKRSDDILFSSDQRFSCLFVNSMKNYENISQFHFHCYCVEFYTKTICTFSILQLLSIVVIVVVVVRVVYFGYFVVFNVRLFFRYLLVCLHTKKTTATTTITTTADVNYKCTNVRM